jgi:hypothetical protein
MRPCVRRRRRRANLNRIPTTRFVSHRGRHETSSLWRLTHDRRGGTSRGSVALLENRRRAPSHGYAATDHGARRCGQRRRPAVDLTERAKSTAAISTSAAATPLPQELNRTSTPSTDPHSRGRIDTRCFLKGGRLWVPGAKATTCIFGDRHAIARGPRRSRSSEQNVGPSAGDRWQPTFERRGAQPVLGPTCTYGLEGGVTGGASPCGGATL